MRKIGIFLCAFLAACGAQGPAEQAPVQEIASEAAQVPVEGPERVILAFGDSLFAGYNLQESEGYPERLQVALRERGINARVIDAGVSGDTSQAGAQRLAFVLDNLPQMEGGAAPDLALVELGGNDLLRGLQPDQTRENLETIMAELARRDIPVVLMGMRAPPNYGVDFQQRFDAIYPALAQEYRAGLVPFFLEPVYGQDALMLDDRIHPNPQGVDRLVAATIDTVVAALPEE